MEDGFICFLGIGSNRGDPVRNCAAAWRYISAIEGITVLKRSSLYRTQPVGVVEQDWFVNGVIEVRTALSPRSLLGFLLDVEDVMGRVRTVRWGPRLIDIDILLYGQVIVDETELVVPHPRLHTRRFVLVPLSEIAPHAVHPVFGLSVRGLVERLDDTSIVEWLSSEWDHSGDVI